eukprot:NODE_616_length_1756_cov_195.494782_g606_i0.p1 GENE.NODE_616_length_1756_cov_195.494782_g606_i0~~NODE_616_length_1756_cov_195.494782_g606_i0.p1  ORF type:complete len:557 (-),score=166.04 NODE_616_length_1756_cov_195.494782_g606_i0:86-1702(-)
MAAPKKEALKRSLLGVISSIDGTIAVGRSNASASVGFNEVVEIESQDGTSRAVVFDLRANGELGLILLDNTEAVRAGLEVFGTGDRLRLRTGFDQLGKVINPLGTVMPTALCQRSAYGYVDADAPNIISRQPVNYNILTGFKVIDSLIPVGRGQRELIVGDRQTGKTSIAVSTILNQVKTNEESLSKNNVLSVYVSIGQRMSNVARIYKLLSDADALRYTTIVAATAAAPAGLQYLAPYSGTTLGETFRDSGRHVLLVYDDLSKQAVAYRQLALLLRRPPGREAYPGDVFYLHSRLLERSAMMSPQKGAGSLTSLPVVETLSNDVTAYIVTNVISITDGQIYLDQKLFTGGQRPAVNIGLSVSRVGSSAQNQAMKKVGGRLKAMMGEYRKMAGEQALGGGELSPIMLRGARTLQLFNQKSPAYFLDSIVPLYAVLEGFMDNVKLQYTKFYEFLMVGRDLPMMYGQTSNKFFYMYNKKMNYMVRLFGLHHPAVEPEVKEYLKQHTQLFMQNFQARMEQLKDDKDVVRLKNMLYACKRVC